MNHMQECLFESCETKSRATGFQFKSRNEKKLISADPPDLDCSFGGWDFGYGNRTNDKLLSFGMF